MQHPGITLSSKIVDELLARRTQKNVSTDWWISKLLGETPTDYKSSPCQQICVNWDNSIRRGEDIALVDGPMSYRLALLYAITGEENYKRRAIEIMGGWIKNCTECTGDNKQLTASWSQSNFARTMELLAYIDSTIVGFKDEYLAWYDKVMKPAVEAPITWKFKNGDVYTNWHCAVLECRISIAVLRDDKSEFNACITKYKEILQVIIKLPWCLPNESLYRDFMHGCMSLGSLVHICETAYHEGVDLYGDTSSLLFKAIEASAKIVNGNLPDNLPQELQKLQYWPYCWYIAFGHYNGRRKYNMPNTFKVISTHPVDYSWLFSVATGLTHLPTALKSNLMTSKK
jgi:hypothetical protein